jgi:hypothetical protein
MTALIGKESIGLGAMEARYQTIVSAIKLPQFYDKFRSLKPSHAPSTDDCRHGGYGSHCHTSR